MLQYVRYDNYYGDKDNENVDYSFLQGKKTAVMPCLYVFIYFPVFSVV